ncbi:prepilin-type N-terminal cleavage/methylation domain-containing protein [Kitasatospora purpeofusca]
MSGFSLIEILLSIVVFSAFGTQASIHAVYKE